MNTQPNTLELFTIKSLTVEAMLVATAILLPVVLHLVPGINVFILLPMHWTIFCAGLLYGWRGGLIAGLVSPVLSFLLTGMPLAVVLPLIVSELALYGAVTGVLREKTKLHDFVILAIASICGRLGFLLVALLLGRIGNLADFAYKAFLPGSITAVVIISAVPFLSGKLRKFIEHL